MEFWGRVTAYLQLLQPDLIGRHVIFNTDKMEGQARALVAFEGRKRGPVAHMQHIPSFHQPARCWIRASLFMFLYLPVCFQQLVEPEFMLRHRLPSGEPQMLLVAPPDLATLEHLYSGDQLEVLQGTGPRPLSIHVALLQSPRLFVCSTLLSFNLSIDSSA